MKTILIGALIGSFAAICFSHFYYFRYNTNNSKRVFEISLSKGSIVIATEKIPPGIRPLPSPIIDFYSHESPPPDPFGVGEREPSNHSIWKSLLGEIYYLNPFQIRHSVSLPISICIIVSALGLAFTFRNTASANEHEAEQGESLKP